EGWTDCGPSGSGKSYSCEDTYNFSALPGGLGLSTGGGFVDAGVGGYWWSASEGNSHTAYNRFIFYSYEAAGYYGNAKGGLQSVRCLQD
ncbi:MAG: fibrobacter succinogenes major paralogous domain-containing protein, partial [Fibromonadales bacterium]|nr:fibrobacter succinogenes major paralogous domain-containing protein [Fibromonadales bacterium]